MSPAKKRLITLKILLTLLILFISFTPLKTHAAISGLWHLDEGTGQTIVDSSGNDNNGTLNYVTNPLCTDADGPDWTKGKLNTGVRFDGCNDYALIPFSSTLDVLDGDPFAFTIWFKVDMLPSVANRHYIIFQQQDGTIPGSGKPWLYINKNNNEIGTALSTPLSSGVKVIANTWYFVILNYDGSNLSLYVNADFKGSPSTTTIIRSDGDYLLGLFKSESNPLWFSGTIDEVKIYDNALTTEEIADEYLEGSTIASWHMDEGTGSTIFDATTNNNDGTVYNGVNNPGATWVAGKPGNAIYLDGENDFGLIPFHDQNPYGDSLDVLNGGPFAYTMWFKVEALPSVADRHYILFQQQDGTIPGSGKPWLYINKNNDEIGTALSTPFSSGIKVITDTWYFITLNYDSSNLTLYVNADFKGSPSTTTIIRSNGDYLLGVFKSDSNPFWFNGVMDEISIYDRALTPDEIVREYEEGPPLPPTNLEAIAGDNVVALSWSPNSEPDLAGYNIYRSTTSGQDYTWLNTTSLIITSNYTDTDVVTPNTYYYVVTAVDTGSNESVYSSEVPATPVQSAPEIHIISPSDASTINSSWITVSGTINDNTSAVMVNNILASINGNAFTADAVPLSVGSNTITAVAANNSGLTDTDTITIHTDTATDPVILSASPLSGTSPLDVSLTVTTDIENPISRYEYDFDNDGAIDYTSTTSGNTSNTYTEIRLYHPVILVTDNTGLKFSNANPITITVHLPSQTTITFASGDPVDIVNDNNGNIYVLDSTASTVSIYDIDGNFQRSFGSSGVGEGQFIYPKGIAVDNTGNIYVADTGNSRIQKFDNTGAYLLQWSAQGSGVAVDDGHVYVSDTANNTIEQFDTDGNYISGWGGVSLPNGIYAEDGYVYVADSGNNQVQKFTTSGSSIMTITGLNNPTDVTIGSGYIYVADTGNARVVKYDSDGNIAQEIKADLVSPIAVAHGSRFTAETIYVVDNGIVKEIELPVTSPVEVWNAMKQRLIDGDIEGALTYFSEDVTSKYRRVFIDLGSDLSGIVNSLPEPVLITLHGDIAEYAITRLQDSENFVYIINLIKDENGIWKIDSM